VGQIQGFNQVCRRFDHRRYFALGALHLDPDNLPRELRRHEPVKRAIARKLDHRSVAEDVFARRKFVARRR